MEHAALCQLLSQQHIQNTQEYENTPPHETVQYIDHLQRKLHVPHFPSSFQHTRTSQCSQATDEHEHCSIQWLHWATHKTLVQLNGLCNAGTEAELRNSCVYQCCAYSTQRYSKLVHLKGRDEQEGYAITTTSQVTENFVQQCWTQHPTVWLSVETHLIPRNTVLQRTLEHSTVLQWVHMYNRQLGWARDGY